jgi:hypothetical protein
LLSGEERHKQFLSPQAIFRHDLHTGIITLSRYSLSTPHVARMGFASAGRLHMTQRGNFFVFAGIFVLQGASHDGRHGWRPVDHVPGSGP